MDRRNTMLCMRDVLDHLNRCYDQWQAAEGRVERFVVQSMERDLAELQRICRDVRRHSTEGAGTPELELALHSA
jgi:hypothetical protein